MSKTTTQTHSNVSMEAIAFQDNKFGLALEALFEQVLAEKKTAIELQEQYSEQFGKVIKQFTNLPVNLFFQITIFEKLLINSPAVYVNTFTSRHVFNKASVRESELAITDKSFSQFIQKIKQDNLINTIDLKRAWVTGIFAEVPVRMIFPLSFVYDKKLTTQELTGILLHEIGHVFTMCEYANRVNTTNQVLAGLMRSSQKDALDVQHIVFQEAGEFLFNDNKTFAMTEEITDTQAKFAVILNAIEQKSRSEHSTAHYDFVSCEQQADQFASRMGYGRHIVTGLDKAFVDPTEKSAFARHFVNFSQVMFPVIKNGMGLMASVSLGPQVFLIIAMITVFSVTLTTYTKGELNRPHTYDSTRVRYLRLREDLLTRIKNKQIPDDLVKECLQDIAEIDKVLDGMLKTETKSYLEIASNFIFKKHRQAVDARMLQRQLEELASNDLYRVAAKLRTV